ncbi:response regulator transcription factor [Carnobacteriaceae bacterium zg-ZUI240]|nr:response regulator transcription factor [Carnobacteriaceae bacterium zg-ZUI240]
MINILLVEDDFTIANATVTFLKQHNLNVWHASTLKQAHDMLHKHPITIALLDMMLPDGNALDFYQTLPHTIKIIFLTAVDDEKAIIETLHNGVEDYITKPFRLPILLARIQGIITRYSLNEVQWTQYYHLHVNEQDRIIKMDNQDISLSATESRLFFYLFANRSQTLTREQLLTYMWDNGGDFVNDNTLTVTLKRLRKKIEKDSPLIETIRGLGYRMKGDNHA